MAQPENVRWVQNLVQSLFSKVSVTFEHPGWYCTACGRQKTPGPPGAPAPTEPCLFPEKVLNVQRLAEAHQRWTGNPPPDDFDDLDLDF